MRTEVITEVDALFEALEELFDWANQIDMSFAWASRTEVLGPTVDRRRFSPAHGVRPAARTVECNLAYPIAG